MIQRSRKVDSGASPGGPAFLPPLYAAGLLPSLLSQLSPDYVPLKLIVGTLETLNSVADAIVHAGPRLNIFHAAAKPLCALLYAEPGTTTLAELLRLKANSRAAQRAVCLTVKIIAKTCSQEQDRYEAVKARLLDLLAGRLASCVVSLGYCPPTADLSVIQSLPSALPKTELPSLMLALCAIVQNSTYRASKLLYSPPIIAVFPPKNDQPFSSTSPASNPFDQLLPRVQATRQKTDKNSKAFPPLGSLHDASEFHSDPNVQEAIANLIHDAGWITDDMESPLLSWLMYLIRTQWGKTQLTAAWLLTVLCRAVGPFQRNKLKMLATFVIPIVVSMLADQVPAEGPKSASTYGVPNPTVDAGTRAMTPRILAELMSSRPALQSINTNLKMRDLVMKGLKGTFQPSGEDKRLWSPVPAAERQHHVDLPETRRLGPPGCTDKKLAHYSRREAYLLAVAALTQKDDAHRKFFIEKGVIQCLLDSLKPLAEDLTYPKGSGEEENAKKQGNPTPVLVAACNTARALARSVAGLRTSLVDGGIAMPIYELLKHPDIDVQTAATDALCNLLLDFSPMKQVSLSELRGPEGNLNLSNYPNSPMSIYLRWQPLLEAGVIRTLCEQAHSANANMRHISIWALKQAVSYAPDAIKIQALEDIGPGWLVQIISGEQRQPSAAAQSIGLGTANAMGEQVDLLNAPLPSESVDKEMEDGESDGEPSSPMQSAAEFDYTQITTQFPQPSSKIRAHLNQLYRNETSPILRAQRDDLQLQEQALEFARNLIYQPAAAGANPRPEMIDHVLRELGTTQVFALLQQKLAIEVPLSGNSADTLRAQPTCRERLCISAILFLNNVAAGRPSHRALLLSHPHS